MDNGKSKRCIRVVWIGHPAAGKTTTLAWLQANLPYQTTALEHESVLEGADCVRVGVELPDLGGRPATLELATFAGAAPFYRDTWRHLLEPADAVVCLVDSVMDRLDSGLSNLELHLGILAERRRYPDDLPWVFQWNRRDLDPGEMWTVAELDGYWNPWRAPAAATCAATGEGLLELFELVKGSIERRLAAPKTAPRDRVTPPLMDTHAVSVADALRGGRALELWLGLRDGVDDACCKLATDALASGSPDRVLAGAMVAARAGSRFADDEAAVAAARDSHDPRVQRLLGSVVGVPAR